MEIELFHNSTIYTSIFDIVYKLKIDFESRFIHHVSLIPCVYYISLLNDIQRWYTKINF